MHVFGLALMFAGALLTWWALGGTNPRNPGTTSGGSGLSPGGTAGGGSSGNSGGGSW